MPDSIITYQREINKSSERERERELAIQEALQELKNDFDTFVGLEQLIFDDPILAEKYLQIVHELLNETQALSDTFEALLRNLQK